MDISIYIYIYADGLDMYVMYIHMFNCVYMFINTNDGIYHQQYVDGTEYDRILVKWESTGYNGISWGICIYIYTVYYKL